MRQPINFDLVSDIYDSYVQIDTDIPFFLKETEDFKGEILELMCGTGRISIPLLKNKKKLTCVDYSPGMINAFRKKVEGEKYNLTLLKMDVTELKLDKKFGMILLPFHSLSEILEEEKQKQALIKISEHLRKNGTFICALQNPVVRLKTADGRLYKLGDFISYNNEKFALSYTSKWDPQEEIVSGYQYYEFYNEKNEVAGKRILEINFRPITDDNFREMVKDSGMEIKDGFGDYSYSPFDPETSSYMIYRLVKK